MYNLIRNIKNWHLASNCLIFNFNYDLSDEQTCNFCPRFCNSFHSSKSLRAINFKILRKNSTFQELFHKTNQLFQFYRTQSFNLLIQWWISIQGKWKISCIFELFIFLFDGQIRDKVSPCSSFVDRRYRIRKSQMNKEQWSE